MIESGSTPSHFIESELERGANWLHFFRLSLFFRSDIKGLVFERLGKLGALTSRKDISFQGSKNIYWNRGSAPLSNLASWYVFERLLLNGCLRIVVAVCRYLMAITTEYFNILVPPNQCLSFQSHLKSLDGGNLKAPCLRNVRPGVKSCIW